MSDLKKCSSEKKLTVESSGKKGSVKKDYIVALKTFKTSSSGISKKKVYSKPTYKSMIIDAVVADSRISRKGASHQSIKSYIKANYPSVKEESVKTYTSKTLKKLAADGVLEMNGVRYKLSSKEKKTMKKISNKKPATKPATAAPKTPQVIQSA